MAPHSTCTESLWETSSYTPSSASIRPEERAAGCITSMSTVPRAGSRGNSRAVDSHDREGGLLTARSSSFTLADLQEIEDAAAYFDGSCLAPSGLLPAFFDDICLQTRGSLLERLQAEHFPLPKLSAKIRERSMKLPRSSHTFSSGG